ncbi:MAG: CHAT domain-containing protein [Bacteroidia bacterium]|nr:CHAT domain-containing protein [Bacteroidia bacterium]
MKNSQKYNGKTCQEQKTEVRNIDGLLRSKGWESDLYLNENALEEVVKQVQNPSVLHIATHGFFMHPIKKSEKVIPSRRLKPLTWILISYPLQIQHL